MFQFWQAGTFDQDGVKRTASFARTTRSTKRLMWQYATRIIPNPLILPVSEGFTCTIAGYFIWLPMREHVKRPSSSLSQRWDIALNKVVLPMNSRVALLTIQCLETPEDEPIRYLVHKRTILNDPAVPQFIDQSITTWASQAECNKCSFCSPQLEQSFHVKYLKKCLHSKPSSQKFLSMFYLVLLYT